MYIYFHYCATYFTERVSLVGYSVSSCCRPYWRCYYANTDAVIYVVDSADRDRMGISKSELYAMLEVCVWGCMGVGVSGWVGGWVGG